MTDDAASEPTAFEVMGGEGVVRTLVDRFYDAMDSDVRFQALRGLHPESLEGSRDKLYWFLCGWLGGPDLYIERLGHPRLRGRHLPFAIGIRERDEWLACMDQALRTLPLSTVLRDRLNDSFFKTADFMRNKGG